MYILRWFFPDLIGDVPFSMFKYFKRPSRDNDMEDLMNFNFAYTPRVFTVLLFIKLFRIRHARG